MNRVPLIERLDVASPDEGTQARALLHSRRKVWQHGRYRR